MLLFSPSRYSIPSLNRQRSQGSPPAPPHSMSEDGYFGTELQKPLHMGHREVDAMCPVSLETSIEELKFSTTNQTTVRVGEEIYHTILDVRLTFDC